MPIRLVQTHTHVVAVEDERVSGTMGVLSQPGRVGLIFPPELDRASPGVADRLIEAALKRLGRAGAAFVQLTLPPDDENLAAPFLGHGFARLTDAVLLEKRFQVGNDKPPERSLRTIPCDPESDAPRLVELIRRINLDSQDCPELDALRTPADLFAAHRGASEGNRARWWRYEEAGNDVGVVLGTTVEDAEAWEILFFGVVSEERGRGLGRQLLQHFECQAALETAHLRAGMDSRNIVAKRVYEANGYLETGRLRVWIHPLPGTA